MHCDCETPCRECKEEEVEIVDETPLLLESAFMARIKADEYREALAALQKEFDERPDVVELKRQIEYYEEARRRRIAQAKATGITKQGSFLLKVRTRKTRTVIPERFFARFGAETFVKCSTVAIGKAEAAVGKGTFDDCCEVEVKEIGVSVEYERPEAAE
ncbi:MAG: hypothetical protein WC277_06155 [Bacilli bacterium]